MMRGCTRSQDPALLTIITTILIVAASCHTHVVAEELYTLNTSTGKQSLRRVDRETGASTPVVPDHLLPAGSWNGLTSAPGLNNYVFAVHNPPNGNSAQTSRLARIRISDGATTLYPLFDEELIGVGAIFSTGVAISPLDPSVAVVAGFELFGPKVLFTVDVETGAVLEEGVLVQDNEKFEALTYSLDGSTLYGSNSDGELSIVDPVTGTHTTLLDPELTDFITGLAFDPVGGELYVVNAFSRDRLVVTDSLASPDFVNIGHLGIGGPEGLAFANIPEPASATIGLVACLWALGRRPRDRRRPRQPQLP